MSVSDRCARATSSISSPITCVQATVHKLRSYGGCPIMDLKAIPNARILANGAAQCRACSTCGFAMQSGEVAALR